MNVESIVERMEASRGKRARALGIGSNHSVDVRNELGDSSRVRTGNSKIVNLTTDEDTDAVNEARVKIALMGGGLKAELVNKELNNEALKTGTSFGVTLKGTVERKNMFSRVEIYTKTFAVPGAIGIINSNETRLLRRGRLLKGIGGICKADVHAILSSKREKSFIPGCSMRRHRW